MDPAQGEPRCANQIHLKEAGGTVVPTQICSCAAGLIHMHDCPVSMELGCLYFHDGDPDVLGPPEVEQAHERLMNDYLTRPYYHRIRSLAPAGDPWQRRREELYAFYATVELDETEFTDQDDAEYERECERLLALRRRREEARREKEERTREERARERARLGIKTVVEKAREAVATQGNVASSVVDDLELPAGRPGRKRRRGRRKPGAEAAGPGRSGPAAERSGPAPRADAAGPPGQAAGESRPKRRRRRRRRGGRGRGGGTPAA